MAAVNFFCFLVYLFVFLLVFCISFLLLLPCSWWNKYIRLFDRHEDRTQQRLKQTNRQTDKQTLQLIRQHYSNAHNMNRREKQQNHYKKLLVINEICSWLQTFRPSNPGGSQEHFFNHYRWMQCGLIIIIIIIIIELSTVCDRSVYTCRHGHFACVVWKWR